MNVAAAILSRSMASLRAEWRPLTATEPIEAAWRALAARALEPNVFYEPAFVRAAAPVFGPDAGVGLVWSQDGMLAGVFPARIERRYGLPLPVLTGWTHPFAPLGTPLVARDAADAVMSAWLDHVASDPGLPGLTLWPLIPDGAFARTLATVLARRRDPIATFGRHQRALLAPGDPRAGYLEQTIGAKKRKELRRQRHRLGDLGAIEIDAVTEVAAIRHALGAFLDLEARGWKGRAGTAAAHDAAVRRFVEDVVAGLAAEHKARIDRLRVAGRAVATIVTLRSLDTAWTWKIAYDEDFARFSPGVQLMLDVTESLLADPGVARADSCADPGHPMIDHLWRERLALSDHLIAVRPQRLGFPLVCRLERLRRSAIAGAKTLRNRLRG
jgi:CelD/BcsL family acetyltransferase involved in cellulose biosynthesis